MTTKNTGEIGQNC